jgi:hypothetical protein
MLGFQTLGFQILGFKQHISKHFRQLNCDYNNLNFHLLFQIFCIAICKKKSTCVKCKWMFFVM